MGSFLKYTLATIVGIIITYVIIFFVVMGIVASSTAKEPIEVKDNSILKLNLTKVIQERQPANPFAQFGMGDDDIVSGLNKIKASLEHAKTDDKIKGIYIDAGIFVGGGMATMQELRNALLDFKESGKFIYAYGENYSQKTYYLSSVADSLFLHPMGMVDFKGLFGQVTFFKHALEKLDVEMQIIRGPNNRFKSAVEPFMYDKMSEANRKQTSIYLGSIWSNILDQVSESRKVSNAQLQSTADKLKAFEAESAKETGLIDALVNWDEMENNLKAKIGVGDTKDINFISINKYAQTLKPKSRKIKEKIAVIYAVGEIQSGEGDDETIGSDRIAKAIRAARKDSTIKAIVFRVNSPGGSAQASEVMYRELMLAKKVKPLVVSMGDYAASGGYYIACMADKIYAQPTTLTGSIGVFGMIPNAQGLLNNKLGITFDGVKTAENADMFDISKPLSPFHIATIQNMIHHTYQRFLQHVADGRNMTVAEVDSLGQGRVWSGIDAKERGLVDELGGLEDAIEYAASLAKLEDYRIKELPKLLDPFEEIIKKINGDSPVSEIITQEMGEFGQYLYYFKQIDKKDQIQARLPFFLSIE